MKFLKILRIGGLILLATSEVMAIYFLWHLLTPRVPPPGTASIVQDQFVLSTIWLWGAGGIIFLLGISIFLSNNRLQYMTALSFCFALIITVAWLRSYGTMYHCYLHDLRCFSDHSFRYSYKIQTGDGGIRFTYEEREDWIAPSMYGNELYRTSGFHLYTAIDIPRAGTWYYPRGNAPYAIWKDGWLDKTGIKLWDGSSGVKGVAGADYNHIFGITLPYWLLLIPCLIFPTIYSTVTFRRWRKTKLGVCSKCNYDLRGNTSDKCPECGTPIPPRKEVIKPETAKPAA